MDDLEKRQSPRHRLSRTVYVATGVSAPLKCELVDISQTGARLKVGDPRSAAQEFLVVLAGGLRRWCRVMWRSDSEIGIHFIDPPQSLEPRR